MNNSDWTPYLKTFLITALVGFALVITQGFWHILLLLLLIAVVGGIWRARRVFIK